MKQQRFYSLLLVCELVKFMSYIHRKLVKLTIAPLRCVSIGFIIFKFIMKNYLVRLKIGAQYTWCALDYKIVLAFYRLHFSRYFYIVME